MYLFIMTNITHANTNLVVVNFSFPLRPMNYERDQVLKKSLPYSFSSW